MAGRKKEKRREKKAEKAAKKEGGGGAWVTFGSEEEIGSSSTPVVRLSPDEFFTSFKEHCLDLGPMGNAMDGIMRNTVRLTQEAWTRQFTALPILKGKDLLWVQLLLTDEDRVIQGKFYALGGVVALAKDNNNVTKRSRDLFREAAPFLLEGAGAGVNPPHWVFSRSMLLANFNGSINDDAIGFPQYDPLDSLLELPQDIPSSVCCTEAFLFFAGDFGVGEGGFNTREAIIQLVRDLTTAEGILKLDAFTVCCGSAKVTANKLEKVKKMHHLTV